MELILDTNIYRNLVSELNHNQTNDLSKKINELNVQKNIDIKFPISVAMELISHLEDENENEKNECKNALTLLVQTSTKIIENEINVNFVPPLNVILGFYFFNDEKYYLNEYSNVINISQKLVGNTTFGKEESKSEFIKIVKEQLEFEKKEIKNNIESYFKEINNGEVDWQYFKINQKERDIFFKKLNNGKSFLYIAQSFMIRAFDINRSKFEKNEINFNKFKEFINEFAPAIKMFELLLAQIGHGTESLNNILDKKWNTIIDISILFGFLYNPKKMNRKIVTEDANMRNKVVEFGIEDKILNLKELKLLYNI